MGVLRGRQDAKRDGREQAGEGGIGGDRLGGDVRAGAIPIRREEANCKIVEIKDFNYTLNCFSKENIYYDLQSSVSFIDSDDILLLNFDNNTNSTLIIENENENNFYQKYYRNKSGLSSTSLFLILFFSILCPVIIFILIFFIIRRKIERRDLKEADSTAKNINQS